MFNPRKQHDTQQKKKIVHDSWFDYTSDLKRNSVDN